MVVNAATLPVEHSTRRMPLPLEEDCAQIMLDSIGDAVVSIDLAGCIAYLNPKAQSMTGWSNREAVGRPFQEVLRIVDEASSALAPDLVGIATVRAAARDEPAGLTACGMLVHRDGHAIAVEQTVTPLRNRCGQVSGAVVVFHDLSAVRALSLQMSHLAYHDFLTDLPNRRLLTERLTQAIALAQRHGYALAVLFVDLDRFKPVNDVFGHAAGDRLLQSIARRLAAGVRASDTVSRHGGDEFVVLLSELACEAEAAGIADNIVAELNKPHRIDGQELFVTASIGIGMYPDDGADAETLLKNADHALFRAKAQECGRYRFFMDTARPTAE